MIPKSHTEDLPLNPGEDAVLSRMPMKVRVGSFLPCANNPVSLVVQGNLGTRGREDACFRILLNDKE